MRRGRGGIGFRVRKQRRFAGGEKTFQQQHGRDLVDGLRAVQASSFAGDLPGRIQQRMSIHRCQPFVDEMEDELGMRWRKELAQSFRERFRFFRLRTWASVSMQRIADDDDFYFVLTNEARNGFQVRAQRCSAESEERLRGDAESIGDGDADAAIANVQRECAGMRHRKEDKR